MADYFTLKNAALIAPTTTQDLGSETNRYGNVFLSGNISLDSTTITSTNVITPKVTSIVYVGADDTAADIAGGQTITLNGTGFASGASVLIAGTVVSVVSFVSSTQLTLVTPVLAAGSYVLYVVNPDGGTAISIPGIQYSGVPAWSTAAGTLGNAGINTAINITLAAVGDAPVTYSVFSGTLPPGVTLNSSTGFLSGTTPSVLVETTYSFVIRATDLQNQDTNRSFSFTVTVYTGKLYSWGRNTAGSAGYDGALGLGDIITRSSPTQVGSLTNWKTASGAGYSMYAITTDGALWSSGSNVYGQLGLGNTTNISSPQQVGSLTNWLTVYSKGFSVLATKTNGTLWAWGQNSYGQLGLGNTTHISSPQQVGSLTDWLRISGGNYHALAIKTNGTLWAWGYGQFAAMGDGTTISKSSPVQIGSLTNWSKIASGHQHSLAIKTDGTLWTWGQDGYVGTLGLGTTLLRQSSPVQVGALTNWLDISGSSDTTAAIKTTGTLWTWGANDYGQLGLGNTNMRSSPVQVGLLTDWATLSLGTLDAAATKSNNTLWTWGRNSAGQLGLGDTNNRSSPVQIGAMTNWQNIFSGWNFKLAISG